MFQRNHRLKRSDSAQSTKASARPSPTTRRWSALLVGAAAATAAVTLVPAPAYAASTCNFDLGPRPAGISCTTDYSSGSKVTIIKTGTGSTLRAAFYDSRIRYSGDRLLVYGSGSCSASTGDTDFKLSSLPDGWNDKISSVEDYAACDVNLYEHTNFGGDSTGYVNHGEQSSGGGSHLWSRNDWTSSFKLS